nr:hypothetical protein [Rhizobium sp. WL3]
MRLPSEAMILKSTGHRPALAQKIRYHADPEFQTLFDPSEQPSPHVPQTVAQDLARIKAALARDPLISPCRTHVSGIRQEVATCVRQRLRAGSDHPDQPLRWAAYDA